MLILVTGGARSGKSRFARERLEQQPGTLLFVATAEARDDEMQERIFRHRQERGARWKTLEEPLALVEKLPSAMQGTDGILLDCITLWISNLFFAHAQQPESVLAECEQLLALFSSCNKPVFLVTNEVGSGIVPEHAMARQFRDLAGFINQKLAAAADQAYLLAAGLPLRLK
jgi:adenosylcobinamide kinase / adenosylcobinamide-phosphate guanylyltransferase